VSGLYRHPSQEEKTLALLASRGPAWTPAPELARIAIQYCRVIACLRRRGYRIENRVEVHDGVKHGFYRMLDVNPPPGDSQHETIPAAEVTTRTLFPVNDSRAYLDPGETWRDPEEGWR
jgi:hypothetical protein